MKLVVQLPALNEEKTIKDVIDRIPRNIPGVDEVHVLVVDDGSSDRTDELAREAGAEVIRHEVSRGVGAAFRTGVERATALGTDILVTIDSDGQFNPADIPKVIQPILDKRADFVTASRFIDKSLTPEMPRAKRWGNNFMARWISALIKKRFYDVSCGFRAYSKEAYMRLVLLGEFTYTHETFLNLAFARVAIAEVPIAVRGTREHGQSRVANNLFHYGYSTASIILKTYRDYRPLRFFGWLAFALSVVSFGFFLFLMSVKFRTGLFTPHKWSGFVAASLAGTAVAVYMVGLVAEMLDRIRVAQDELLFRVRRLESTIKEIATPDK
ncbi:MAG: glycosyltransferase family 2 protein [Spartobacteria bacterium]|nr:glycosyltransferase family 2 protein [Spartobacteria bacterium]